MWNTCKRKASLKALKTFRLSLFGAVACAVSSGARADQEASNVPHVATDDYGRCLVHSIPDSFYGVSGRTDVYFVGDNRLFGDGLTLVHSYEWFAQQIYVACNIPNGKGTVAPTVVQIGPWPRGHVPNDETLAIAFHYNGETLAEYSTLDIADGDPANASCSVSHYTVIESIDGFNSLHRAGSTFTVTTVDGRRLSFDATRGELINTENVDSAETRGLCPDLD